jgi:mono/diheme cytochrome c family protein
MTPGPPYLLDAARRWTPGELDHLVGKGVKMTGMPAWSPTLSQPELADMVTFLEALPDITPAQYARLRSAEGSGGRAFKTAAR